MASRKRKEYGQGQVYEYPKGSGRWFTTVYDHGKPITRRAASREAAEAKRVELLSRREEGLNTSAAVMNISALVNLWWERAPKEKGLAPKTLRDYRDTIERYILPDWGNYKVEEFERNATLALDIHKTLRASYSHAVAARAIAKLSMLFNAAVRWRLMKFNPIEMVRADIPPYKAKEREALSIEQTLRVFAAVETHRLAVLYHVALTLGLRLGELLGLQWIDVDWKAKTLTIRRQGQEVGGVRLQRDKTKSDAGDRKIPLPPRLFARMLWLWEHKDTDSVYIFPSDEGTMMTQSVFERHWRGGLSKHWTNKKGERKRSNIIGMRQKAGLPATITPHNFRHTVETRLMEQGTPDEIRDKIMGHGKKGIRQHYAHATLAAMRRALEDYERVLWENEEGQQTGT